MTIWLTSDLHIGHEFVARMRGFSNVDFYNKTIINRINKRVTESDTLWILGDIALGGWKNNLLKLNDLRAGSIHVVLGNHDRPFPANSCSWNHINDFKAIGGFDSVQTTAMLDRMVLSHFPYEDIDVESESNCFDQWRVRDLGLPIVHGHTHSKSKLTYSSAGTPQVHVGLDAWGMYPVSLFEVQQLLEQS